MKDKNYRIIAYGECFFVEKRELFCWLIPSWERCGGSMSTKLEDAEKFIEQDKAYVQPEIKIVGYR